ncbi:peptidoglycan DD-metalloendopeptidase family protein [Sphingomonas sp.]|uniref:murein hydrolase activator EnvC family protein n=1 Tax=Sphingomonas sp. TaxID=28214 RepID=UPI0025F822A1|nr:peptidoglycan DD-metalloendopeptidase family protein [Sphingomonas sp.]MBV9528186.1 peptidoglycan DD-metalloendopeptidase family protein [Sphingomonas sp.]
MAARSAFPLLLAPLLLAASGPVQPVAQQLDQTLREAQAEQAEAEAQSARLLHVADEARGQAAKLQAQQLAAVQALEASEAQITGADAQVRLISARLAAQRARLRQEQQPVSSLLAGLALMAQRPPLLAIADQHSTDDLVRIRILLGATLPAIRRRAAALSAQLGESTRLERQASAAREDLERSRILLTDRRRRLAALEQRSLQLAGSASSQSLTAGDAALASGEQAATLQRAEAGSRSAWALASAVAAADPAPPRPGAAASPSPRAPFAYQLPAVAPVVEGLGAVNGAGVRSRGLTLHTGRGAAVIVPAGGVVRFSGPYRSHDGVVIIDHGGGWASLLVGVAANLQPGTRVAAGEPLGRALGPIEVELSHSGTRVSPALIAGSSEPLSNGAEGG